MATTYQWLLNGNQIPDATSQTLFITQTGMYIVDVTDSNGCVNSASQYVLISGGVDESEGEKEILIFPNLSDGNFIVGFSCDETSEIG